MSGNMPERPDQHFECKWRLAIKDITRDSALIVLAYRSNKERGIVVAYQVKNDNPRLIELSDTIALYGVGKPGDFRDIRLGAKAIVNDYIYVYGEEALKLSVLNNHLAAFIGNRYNTGSRGFGVETLLIEVRQDRPPQMLVINPDGDTHRFTDFAIIGGYRSPDASTESKSNRDAIKEILGKRYNQGLPAKAEAKRIAFALIKKFGPAGKHWKARLDTLWPSSRRRGNIGLRPARSVK
jgi:20S proteasome alpha/beta subunit